MDKKKLKLSVVLAVFNEVLNIRACLDAVRDVASEIIVVDGGSTDGTADAAKKAGAKVYRTDNPPIFHINKQKALELAKGEWILQLDADEIVSQALKREILNVIEHGTDAGYFIPRRNYFLGDWLRKGGQYPDYVIRLFRNGKGSFPQKSVHEQITIDGSVGHLKEPLDHYSYTSVAHYWQKSASYIRLTAAELTATGNVHKPSTAISFLFVRPMVTFLSLVFRHKGFLDGWRGVTFAAFSALHYPKAYLLARSSRAT